MLIIDGKVAHQSFILYALLRFSFLTRFSTSPMCSAASSKFVTRTLEGTSTQHNKLSNSILQMPADQM